MVRCEYCDQRSNDDVNVCPYCGAPLPVPDCSQDSGSMSETNDETEVNTSSVGTIIGSTIAAIGGAVIASNRRPPVGMRPGPRPGHPPMGRGDMRGGFRHP